MRDGDDEAEAGGPEEPREGSEGAEWARPGQEGAQEDERPETAQQNRMADSTFAFPKKRKEPLNDAKHVRNAIARFDQVEGVTDRERDAAWKCIRAAAKKFNVEVSESCASCSRAASGVQALTERPSCRLSRRAARPRRAGRGPGRRGSGPCARPPQHGRRVVGRDHRHRELLDHLAAQFGHLRGRPEHRLGRDRPEADEDLRSDHAELPSATTGSTRPPRIVTATCGSAPCLPRVRSHLKCFTASSRRRPTGRCRRRRGPRRAARPAGPTNG